ncbi:MAG: helix-turn-helix transcriptional regulator [Gemmatimonadetes bacterium]|nr:helix-turn-helix transcriptional regulator [Gemmatimonadota bacterium]MCY3679538.1 helix-turn-helix transcriptional regulator [Gemmatimonadota bacterium]MYA42548.1 helix-turn-helix transcriptional regulator [Gemmatimonadota bacterium]MYE94511.1 helix-turn-helix transcriptional regulator [Gemmatimonadota bacterium]MYJ12357.1 helix-turn-helix transcriptional regulator [Gemmatimonadota bacterium]
MSHRGNHVAISVKQDYLTSMSMESTNRIGSRLKAARERSGLTQQQLADAVGLRHRQTVASIESGERRLSASELIGIMPVLGVDLDYFTDPFRLVGEGQFSFRTSAGVEPQVLDRFEQRAGMWIATYRELSREEGHPPRWLGYKLNLSADSSFEDAQAAGEAAVEAWGLGPRPAERLRSVMEDRLHVLVLHVDMPPGVSGAASRVPGLNCALINRQESTGRRKFDLAHELFHLLTWDALPPERATVVNQRVRGSKWRVEKLAENFAAALLMPAPALKPAWDSEADADDMHDRINKVASQFRVSSPACKWRLYNLGLLSKRDLGGIEDWRLSGKGHARCGDRERPLFSASFAERLSVALDRGRLSVKRAAALLGVSVTLLAEILHDYGHETYFEA